MRDVTIKCLVSVPDDLTDAAITNYVTGLLSDDCVVKLVSVQLDLPVVDLDGPVVAISEHLKSLILYDFVGWSGGYNPGECDDEQLQFFSRSNQYGDVSVASLYSFLSRGS